MKKKFTIFYTIFATIFMLFSLTFLGYNLYKEYKQGTLRTESVFRETIFNLYQELGDTDETKKNFARKVSNAVGDFQDYSYYELSKNGKTVYSFPENIVSEAQTKSNFTKEFNHVIELSEDNKYTLNCSIYLLRPYAIYYYSKITFFMILGITVLTFILIPFTNVKSKNKNEDDLENDEEKFNSDNILSDLEDEDFETELENDIKENVVAVTLEDDIIDNYTQQTSTEKIETDIEFEDILDSELPEEEKELETEQLENEDKTVLDDFADITLEDYEEDNQLENILDDEDKNDNTDKLNNENELSGPEGLFSPSTGLGWESYLLTRLDNELERSVASEMDISLFVIQITDLERDSDLMRQISDYIVEQFQFRDLIFEYKEDCIVAIKNSTTLEDALTFADKVHYEITKLLENTSSKCYIGISTRTVRMISGERFLNEAEEALAHAREDKECSIIAFRADIEKYRKYFENKNED